MVRILFLVALIDFGLVPIAKADDLRGYWDGSVVMRGISWPIQMRVDDNDAKTALLSIRSMGMIDKPVKIKMSPKNIPTLPFPFGIGDFELNPDGDLIISHRKLQSGRRITLLVERLENYESPYLKKEVHFQNGDIKLSGTTYIPKNITTPMSGVVILHGSGPAGRSSWEYRSWADFFARRGMVSLVYDKRAFGDSYPDLNELAADARAALRFTQELPETNNDSVGFFGGSQAAWLATSVASKPDANVAFIVMSGWPAVSPIQQELQSIESNLQNANLPMSEFNDAVAYLSLYGYVARTSQSWNELELASRSAATTDWSGLVPLPEKSSDLDWWHRNANFPTQRHLQNVKCPVLACYGKNDSVVPPSRNAERLKNILSKFGNEDVSIAIFDNADHRIELPMINRENKVQWPQLSPDYLQRIEAWLLKRRFLVRSGS